MAPRRQDALARFPQRQMDPSARARYPYHYQWGCVTDPFLEDMSSYAGMRMPGWFDLATLDKLTDSIHDDEKGMMASVKAVDALIQAEVDAGVPEEKIIVGGFSQGGAISILTGLTTKRKLGGIISLSTWVPLNHKIKEVCRVNSGAL